MHHAYGASHKYNWLSSVTLMSHTAVCLSCLQDGYDHSYFFMATFMDDHVNHHAKALKAAK